MMICKQLKKKKKCDLEYCLLFSLHLCKILSPPMAYTIRHIGTTNNWRHTRVIGTRYNIYVGYNIVKILFVFFVVFFKYTCTKKKKEEI